MKERPILFSEGMVRAILSGSKTMTRRVIKAPSWSKEEMASIDFGCPYGAMGWKLWVRETFSVYCHPENPIVHYRADCGENDKTLKWKPSIFMPRWASRITLDVLDVRVEKLQDITDEDCLKEGIEINEKRDILLEGYGRDLFKKLWDSINLKRGCGWDKNPWVWCVSFRKV
jgi:hypothetical protein